MADILRNGGAKIMMEELMTPKGLDQYPPGSFGVSPL